MMFRGSCGRRGPVRGGVMPGRWVIIRVTRLAFGLVGFGGRAERSMWGRGLRSPCLGGFLFAMDCGGIGAGPFGAGVSGV